MAGAIIENMSGRKLAIIGSVLLVCQVYLHAYWWRDFLL